MNIDLNCDLGEGGKHDAELLSLVTTVNVCCGMHAGDPLTSFATVREAARRDVRIGVHPGYSDRPHFGRREMAVPANQVRAECIFQIGGLNAIVTIAGRNLTHVKPHGALYNQACRDDGLANLLVEVARQFELPIMALPGSALQYAATNNVQFIGEGFADRRYQADGSLVPRNQPGAFVEDLEEAVDQAERLVRDQGVQSICVHGDNPRAVEFVKRLRDELTLRGHKIVPFA